MLFFLMTPWRILAVSFLAWRRFVPVKSGVSCLLTATPLCVARTLSPHRVKEKGMKKDRFIINSDAFSFFFAYFNVIKFPGSHSQL